jgi:short-subunit dehydrogenase
MTEVAWVTGGGTGIGRALAEQLYQRGTNVVITGRRADVLESAAKEIVSRGGPGKIHTISGDAADPTHVAHVVSDTKSRWGDITLLINNAGSNYNRHFKTATDEEYESAFQTNCMSAIRTTLAVLPAMRKSRHGAIVNVSSVYGRWGTATSASYSVSKFALAGYSEVLRQALVGSGVHVLCVFPGYIKTAMTSPFVKEGSLRSRIGKTPEQMAKAILSALRSRQVELYFPWYVPWVLRLHRWMPVWADQLAMKVKR